MFYTKWNSLYIFFYDTVLYLTGYILIEKKLFRITIELKLQNNDSINRLTYLLVSL